MDGEPAFTPSGVIQVVASAGAGKTRALAFRYLALLLGAEDPAEEMGRILAVTFTRKAAGEMRERILAWMEGLSQPRSPEILEVRRELARATGLTEGELAARAERALETLFRRWPFFAVGTIDAFLLSAARASAFEVGLPYGFAVALNPRPRLRRAFLALLYAAGRQGDLQGALEGLLEEKLQSVENLDWDLVGGFLKDQEALHARLAGLAGVLAPLEGMDAALRARAEETSRAAGELLSLLREKGIEIRKGGKFLDELRALAEGGSPAAVTELKSAHWGKETLQEFALKASAPRVGPQEEAAWARLRRSLGEYALHHALALGNPALLLEERLSAALEEASRRENTVLLDRLVRALAGHLAGGGLPSVYLALGDRYRHLLVDEFQDTSEVQWQALRPLAEEALSRGGSFFYVGDPKQAIYRFRGGAPHLFGEVYEDLGEHFGGRREVLPRNHRSREVLVEFFNATFSEEALKAWSKEALGVSKEEYDRVLAPVFRCRPQEPAGGEGGYVRIVGRPSGGDGESGESLEGAAREAAQELLPELLGRGFRPGDVAFLVRRNEEARVIAGVLEETGHRVATESAARVTTHPRVQELLALLRFLDAPTDDRSFATFAAGALMAEAAAIPPGELHGLLARWASTGQGALYRAYREAFPGPWEELIEPLFQGVGYLAPYDLLQDFLERSRAFQRFPGDEAFLAHFLEVVSRKEREGAATAGSLLASLEEDPEEAGLEVPLPEGGDAFRVLTVHKAKGLSFPVVVLLLPLLAKPQVGDFLLRDGGKLRWVRTKKPHRVFSSALQSAYRENELLALRDELSTFYVALTRAQDELHVVLAENPKGSPRLLPLQGPREFGTPVARRETPGAAARFLIRPEARSPWRSRILPPADPAYRPPAPEAWEAVRVGKRIHGVLEAGFGGAEGDGEILAALGARPGEARETAGRLTSLRAHPLLGPLLHPPKGDVLNEVEILDGDGRIYRVDRLIVEEDRVTVVDWKTGQETSEEHRRQVALYCRLVSALYPGRRVLGRLAYLALGRVEEVPW
ncbi:MAG: UvrD-helicase domain-containing protein [Acidobacteriota bacterium]